MIPGPAPVHDNPMSVDWWHVPPDVSSQDVVEEGKVDYEEDTVLLQRSHMRFLTRWEDREVFMREVACGKLPHPEGFSDKIISIEYRNSPDGYYPVDPKIPAAEFRVVWLRWTSREEFYGKKED